MSFWTNFERICKDRGTNPTSLITKKLGLSPSKVTMWKNGSLPKEDMLHKLADALDCKVSDFFDDENASDMITIRIGGKPTQIDPDVEYLVKLVNSCDRVNKHDIMSLCQNFDRSRGLGVIDKIVPKASKQRASGVTSVIADPTSARGSGLNPEISEIIVKGPQNVLVQGVVKGALGTKKKARLVRKPTTVR